MPDDDDETSHAQWGFPCPRCGYDTRAITTDRCPECGTTRTDAAALLSERRWAGTLRQRIAAASITTFAGGVCAFVALAIVTGAYRYGFRNDAERMWAVALLTTCGAGLAIAAINWMRVARPRRPLHFGWTLAVAAMLFYLLMQGL